ncbi:hypothetical protein [Oceanobacillus halotolerans]|uniref:hypothetical protein n=1 Tax=Oceanobacillus halotolerans TaxID=2663380 RepID=UPI0013DA1BFE|nr:hypothetical protein [Oceanobacillus halotolerans]
MSNEEVEGNIIAGTFDQLRDEFTVERVKHFTTQSTLNNKQLDAVYNYLDKRKGEVDGQVLTLFDQLPVQLTQEEIHDLLDDLKQIRNKQHHLREDM